MPWLASAQWSRLDRGETVQARFAVPKVLRSATVTIRLRRVRPRPRDPFFVALPFPVPRPIR